MTPEAHSSDLRDLEPVLRRTHRRLTNEIHRHLRASVFLSMVGACRMEVTPEAHSSDLRDLEPVLRRTHRRLANEIIGICVHRFFFPWSGHAGWR